MVGEFFDEIYKHACIPMSRSIALKLQCTYMYSRCTCIRIADLLVHVMFLCAITRGTYRLYKQAKE